MSVDLHAQLQLLAERWVGAADELARAVKSYDRAKMEMDNLRRHQEEVAKQLIECIGPNTPLRIFKIKNDALLVEWQSGIRRVPIEPPSDV